MDAHRDRIPNYYNNIILWSIGVVFSLILALGFLVESPDLLKAPIVVSAESPTVKLVAHSSGEIHILKARHDAVSKGDFIAYFNGAYDFEDVLRIKKALNKNKLSHSAEFKSTLDHLKSSHFKLGVLEDKFFSFTRSLESYLTELNNNKLEQQMNLIEEEINRIEQLLLFQKSLLKIKEEELNLILNQLKIDSTLYQKKAILKQELSDLYMTFLKFKEEEDHMRMNIVDHDLMIQMKRKEIDHLLSNKEESLANYKKEVLRARESLLINIDEWEKVYTFQSPKNGVLEYMSFINNDDFIEVGTPIFSIQTDTNVFLGKANISTEGAGKIKVGDLANVKLASHPYQEFGRIHGKVHSISSVPNDGLYLVEIELSNNLISDSGKNLNFGSELEGEVEIITQKKKLISRLFNKLRYLNK